MSGWTTLRTPMHTSALNRYDYGYGLRLKKNVLSWRGYWKLLRPWARQVRDRETKS